MTDLVRIPAIAPLELVRLPDELDGETGVNRAVGGRPQIAAQNDVDAIKAWLARFADTLTTFTSYRKEAERLLLWSVIELGKPLSSLTHEDLLVYQRFLGDPQPAERWVMKAGRKWSRFEPDWRPFAGPLAPTSQRQTIVILNTLFSWLVNAGYLAGNPLSLSRQRQRKAKPRITRFLDDELWQEVKASIEAMPRETDREREHHFRVRWLFSLLYICGLRISEVTGNSMGGFFARRDKAGEERWWLEITGKGEKVFSAGVDVMDHTPDKVVQMIEVFHGILKRLMVFPLPTVAALNGSAMGGGCELAIACDMAVATEDTKLGQPEIKLGVFPPIAAILMPKTMPLPKAMELLLGGGLIGAQEALSLGLLNKVFPRATFAQDARVFVDQFLSLSRVALIYTKRAIREASGKPFFEALFNVEQIYLKELMSTADAVEGLNAFMEKRKPVWANK